MPRKKKDNIPIELYLRDCYTCTNFQKTKLLINGRFNGNVLYICLVDGSYVMPCKVDKCKHYNYGKPIIITKEKEIQKSNDGFIDKPERIKDE